VEIVEETISGKKSWKNRKLGDLVDKLQKGDILIITELSRLGRSIRMTFKVRFLLWLSQ
jgi:DNA invertase Pin-like site-specific DNA recombinase